MRIRRHEGVLRRVATLVLLAVASCRKESARPSSTGDEAKPQSGRYALHRAAMNQVVHPGGPTLLVPFGAIDKDASLSLDSQPPESFAVGNLAGTVWSIKLDGQEHTRLGSHVLLELPYRSDRIPEGGSVGISVWSGSAWQRIADSFADPDSGTVVAFVDHFSTFAPTVDAPDVLLVRRWYGRFDQRRTTYAAGNDSEYGWSDSARVVFREEAHAKLEPSERRYIVESFSYRHTYTGEKIKCQTCGKAFVAHEPYEASVSLTEADFVVPPSPGTKAIIDERRADVERYRREVREAKLAMSKADEKTRSKVFTTLYGAVLKLHGAEQGFASVDFPREQKDSYATVIEEGPLDARHLKVEFRSHSNVTYVERNHGPTIDPTCKNWHFTNKAEPKAYECSCPPFFAAEGTRGAPLVHDERKKNPQGEEEKNAEFTTSGDEPGIELKVVGQIAHRIYVPSKDDEDNVVTDKKDWNAIASRVLEARGAVLRAWITDKDKPPDTPPDALARERYAITLVVPKKRTLVLQASFASEAAKLEETCTIAIKGSDLMKAAGSASGVTWSVPLEITRSSAATLRYAMQDRVFDLGQEKLPATLRQRDKAKDVSLEFEGHQSIWIHTLALRVPYLNQSRQTIDLRVVVPASRLLDVCPPLKRDAVTTRLSGGKKELQSETTIHFRGAVVCKPTCVAMALDCLGLAGAQPPVSDSVGKVGQASYDWWASHDGPKETDDLTAPPWIFPFTPNAGDVKRFLAADEADQADPSDANDAARTAAAKKLDTGEFTKEWPYVDAEGDNQEWLATMVDPALRPWQNNDQLLPALKDAHPKLTHVSEDVDVFRDAGRHLALMHLGSGRPGLVGILHKDSKTKFDAKTKPEDRKKGEAGPHTILLVGVVINVKGEIVRLLFHDPYGDLTQHPLDDGYYDPLMYSDEDAYKKSEHEVDKDDDSRGPGTKGAYAPYGLDVHAYDGTIKGRYYTPLWRSDQPRDHDTVRDRLLVGDAH